MENQKIEIDNLTFLLDDLDNRIWNSKIKIRVNRTHVYMRFKNMSNSLEYRSLLQEREERVRNIKIADDLAESERVFYFI